MPVMESQLPKIIVIGAGPVGLSLGLGLAQNGFRVQVVEAGSDPRKRAGPRPARSTALMPLSQETLARLGVWERVSDKGAPLHKLRLIDDQADRWTNPVIEVFSAEEITSTPFGHNVVNADLVDALFERAAEWGEAAVELLFDAPVTGWAPGQVTLGDGVVLEADLILDAAGRRCHPCPRWPGSVCRTTAPIRSRWSARSSTASTTRAFPPNSTAAKGR